MITLDVKQIDDGTYEVSMRCVVSVSPATGPEKNLFFATVGGAMAFGCTRMEAVAYAAANEMKAEIYRRGT